MEGSSTLKILGGIASMCDVFLCNCRRRERLQQHTLDRLEMEAPLTAGRGADVAATVMRVVP